MAEQSVPAHRVRINVSTSVKGQHTYDCTVEVAGGREEDMEQEALMLSAALVEALDLRYPAPAVGEK